MFPWLSDSFTQLSLRAASKKLHHALLFQGPDGLGKREFSQQLAERLLCSNPIQNSQCGVCQACLLNKSGTHPDLHQVESDKQIGVDQIRDAIKKLTGSAQLSGAKVLIIHQADSMTESSANALLKTLEEPTANTYLLLTTDQPNRILPTIKSRCEKILLPLPELDTTIAWVKSQYQGQVDIQFAKLFANRPLALLAELEQDQSFTFDTFKQGLNGVIVGEKSTALLAADWQEHSAKVLKWIQYWIREQIEQAAPHQIDLWFVANNQTSQAFKQMQNPGINKILLLSQVLTSVVKASTH